MFCYQNRFTIFRNNALYFRFSTINTIHYSRSVSWIGISMDNVMLNICFLLKSFSFRLQYDCIVYLLPKMLITTFIILSHSNILLYLRVLGNTIKICAHFRNTKSFLL